MNKAKTNINIRPDDLIQTSRHGTCPLSGGDYLYSVSGVSVSDAPSPDLPQTVSISLAINASSGVLCDMTVHIPLTSQYSWQLTEFMRSIGVVKKHVAHKMDWEKIIDAVGYVRITQHRYRDPDGREIVEAEILRFLDHDYEVQNEDYYT